MSGLTIAWEYLTGYSSATDPSSRDRVEWPPHPGRIFMAMAAAWFETGEDPREGEALRWLETLGDPRLVLPPRTEANVRSAPSVFVPVNGDSSKVTFQKSARLQCAPSIARRKVERKFPCIWIGDIPCHLHWPEIAVGDVESRRAALESLCGKVTRIGHSSSLVRMWLAENPPSEDGMETWVPDEEFAEWQARRVAKGSLDMLDRLYNRRGREEHEKLSNEIPELENRKKSEKGKGSAERKALLSEEIEAKRKRLEELDNRPPIRPKLGLWTGYKREIPRERPSPPPRSNFDGDILILARIEGPPLPSCSTLAVTQALRGAIMGHGPVQPPPDWVSGHLRDGQPLRDGRGHLAFVPLPFVGTDYADGHLLGAALVFPREVSRRERGQFFGPILLEKSGEVKAIKLVMGRLGEWTLVKRDWMEDRHTLTPETWTALPGGWKTWASVTPIVLDRFPKPDPMSDRLAWNAEIAGTIAAGCERLGLPRPSEILVGTTSWHRGSPRAIVKRRPLRGHEGEGTAALGDGFPAYPSRGVNGTRPQVHVRLQFDEPVAGPVLLGAGRFLGYGLCKPLRGETFQ